MKDIYDFLADMCAYGFCDFGQHSDLQAVGVDSLTNIKQGDASYDSPDLAKRIETLDPTTREIVRKVQEYLSTKVLADIPHTLHFNDLWEGVADNVRDFHCDYDEHNPEYMASLNVYLDDSSPETGGALQTGFFDTVIGEIYPKKFSVIAINQSPTRDHRATPCSQTRRLLSFRMRYDQQINVPNDSIAKV